MKKQSNDIVRIKNLIDNDRFTVGENFNLLLVKDLTKLLKDYFDFNDSPKLLMEKSGDKIKVNFSFDAVRIKGFGSIPK